MRLKHRVQVCCLVLAAVLSQFASADTIDTCSITVQPKYVRELAQKFNDKIAADPNRAADKSVAILDFDLIPERDGQKIDDAVAQDVREDLSTAMADVKGVTLVERGQMNEVIASLKLDQSGLIDLDKAKKLGEMLSADYVLCGSISDRGVFVVINARMIDTRTAQIKYTADVDFNK
ncbi:MAG: FlgO family outer membrane protein [Armatimonadota bacterium]|nr:CsgG/HfaB family protein [bacterium]